MRRVFPILALACVALVNGLFASRGDSPECGARADSMRTEAERLEKAGDYEQAARLDSLSGVVYRECGMPSEEGRALERTGFCFWRMGELDRALGFYARARELYAGHGEPRDMASLMNRIGLVYWKKDATDSALSMFGKVMAIGKATGDSALLARGLGNEGMVYRQLGQYGRALECYTRCLSLHRSVGDREKEALALGNMGVLFSSRGQYREALLCFHEALGLARQSKDVRTEGRVLGNMGIVYWNLGLLREAGELYEEQLRTARLLRNKLDEATCLDNLGNLKWAQSDYEGALVLYRDAMAIYREFGNRTSEGIICYDIAQVFLSLGKPEEARRWLQEALEIHRPMRDRWHEALDLAAMGDVELAGKNGPLALQAFERALDLIGENNVLELEWYLRFGKARALETLGKKMDAERLYREALEVIERMRSEVNLESLSTRFLESKMEVYVSLAMLLIREGRFSEAFRVCESAHARTLLDVMSKAGASLESGVPEDLMKRRAACEEEINELDRMLVSSYAGAAPGIAKSDDSARLEEALFEARRRYEELWREIEVRQVSAGSTIPLTVEPLGASELGDFLSESGEGVALLEFLAGKEKLLTFLVMPDTVIAQVQEVGRDSLSRLCDLFRKPFLDLRSGQTDLANLGFPGDVARTLYDITVRPFESTLRQTHVLLVVPDAALHYIPFEALVTGEAPGRTVGSSMFSRYREYDYLLERHTIACAPSASFFREARRMKAGRRYAGELYALGDPSVEEERMIFPYVGEIMGMLRGELTFRFSALPGARKEVEGLADYDGGEGVTVRIGALATEKSFKEEAPGHRYIHLATHGVADDSEPLYSRLVLGVDGEKTNDGFLHAYEVSQMHLGCELVTLSACETALGPLGSGEGLLGLSRSFFHAGSPSVIASLWSVDESAGLVMESFYRNLGKGTGKGEALRLAKLEVMGIERDGVSFAHPFFWAPFILLGDWL
jgi:CHAT domain-containing protein/tetratricopeptide (TPR) repeat protein